MSEIDIYKGMVRNMKDDIKEIMRDLEFCSDTFDYTITPGRCTFLKNYITNLQQENERLLKQLEDISLDEANIRADLMLEQVDYKSRCGKAIEYIQKTKFCDNDECCILNETWFGKKLLNILNGRSDE